MLPPTPWWAGPCYARLGGPSGSGVGPPVDRAQPLLAHVGVHLGRGQAGVAQQLLDHPQVGPPVEQVGGVGVAQGVGVGGRGGPAVEDAPDVPRARGGPRAGSRRPPRAGPSMRPARRSSQARRRGHGGVVDRDAALLVALAQHGDRAAAQVDVAPVEPAQLRDPQPGGVEQLEHGAGRAGPAASPPGTSSRTSTSPPESTRGRRPPPDGARRVRAGSAPRRPCRTCQEK